MTPAAGFVPAPTSPVPAVAVPVIPAPGFADPTRDAQRAFRAVLDALAHPTRSYPLAGPAEPPAALGQGLAAVALALLDEDCAVWLGGGLGRDAEAAAWLAFHTGARRTDDPASAGFVITGPDALPPLASLALGTDEAPHLSATVVLDVRGCAGPARFTARGPGVDGVATLAAPWATAGFADAWRRNAELFPRGVDLLLVGSGAVAALPRTTRLTAVGTGTADAAGTAGTGNAGTNTAETDAELEV
ncbi:phosphonate C-P lyase system protein PhnH [Pseudofrankia asymbiotica]|uniref:phosphonate C-P lyase system protein PhnH n=1 Tax=Pseudofrankia asymbiotica TaxID=1834516 RepID=UPI0009D6CC85|nr:phosphonate C-P lyase system protein PhnH [Pseudofrankia asymbiotica]